MNGTTKGAQKDTWALLWGTEGAVVIVAAAADDVVALAVVRVVNVDKVVAIAEVLAIADVVAELGSRSITLTGPPKASQSPVSSCGLSFHTLAMPCR